ncbi:MAG: hypothetical protein N3D16_08305, partial [Anaerolineales bacterium]|nr:hypothetical protein [Anaerolineales bacterium]
MVQIYLTTASISYLNQFLLSLVITIYLSWRICRRRRQQSTIADFLLTGFFVTVTIFSLTLFLETSLLPTERLFVVYLQNTILALMLVFLIQFAYFFPNISIKHRFERWFVLLVTLAYLLWELIIATNRFNLLGKAYVTVRPVNLDYMPVVLFAWVVFVFGRSTFSNPHDPSMRRFALIFLIPFVLSLLNRLRSSNFVSTPVYHIIVSVGILITLFLFALNYLISRPESTSLIVKFSGVVLTAVLAVFGMAAWLMTPAYAAQYRP